MWETNDIDFLIKNYPKMGKNWCMERLARTDGSIRAKASELGLKIIRDNTSDFFISFQKRAAKGKIGKKRPEQSLLMKRLNQLGKLKKTPEQCKGISDRAKKRIKEFGHPKGMLGKHHTESNKQKMSTNSKRMWANPKSKVNSKEHRQKLSDRMFILKQNGFGRTAYSRGRMGTYDINGKKMFFRSIWEVNYALYLDFLVKQKQILRWEYEVDTFWFEKIKRGVRSYKPDFKVFTTDGSFEYHEVKGWMDQKSKTKLKRMSKYYPKIKMVVIDGEIYRELKKKLGKLIGFYDQLLP